MLGSSLQVMSGYRFVRRAAAGGIPVAIVTRGPSRGDDQATIRLDAPLGVTLSRIASGLACRERQKCSISVAGTGLEMKKPWAWSHPSRARLVVGALGLDALGDHAQVQAVGQGDGRGDHGQ